MQGFSAGQQGFNPHHPEWRRGHEEARESTRNDCLRVGEAAVSGSEYQETAECRCPESSAMRKFRPACEPRRGEYGARDCVADGHQPRRGQRLFGHANSQVCRAPEKAYRRKGAIGKPWSACHLPTCHLPTSTLTATSWPAGSFSLSTVICVPTAIVAGSIFLPSLRNLVLCVRWNVRDWCCSVSMRSWFLSISFRGPRNDSSAACNCRKALITTREYIPLLSNPWSSSATSTKGRCRSGRVRCTVRSTRRGRPIRNRSRETNRLAIR